MFDEPLKKNKMWSPESWKSKSVSQEVIYSTSTSEVHAKLKDLPPIVTPQEIEKLRVYLAEVTDGKRFLLQGGDCAELFAYCSKDPIENKLKVLLQMSLILVWGGRTKVVRIGRMAGQYAKPRSSSTEVVNTPDGPITVPSFRGDNVNGIAIQDRQPDPKRLLDAYFHATATLNYVRGLLGSSFADLHHPESWNLDGNTWAFESVESATIKKEYESIVARLLDALEFMRVIGADGTGDPPESLGATKTVDFFVSHEGLLLDYESCLTRGTDRGYYNLGTHFLWIGDRTRQLDGAHVEYFRGIRNPIGVKVGPSMEPAELVRLLDVLNPDLEKGGLNLE